MTTLPEPKWLTLPITKIRANSYNPNEMSKEVSEVLQNFIKEEGFIQPISVRYSIQDDMYEIVDGEHRFNALKLLGEENVPVVLDEGTDDQAKMSTIAMNSIKGSFDQIKLSRIISKLLKKYSYDQLVAKMGFSEERLKVYQQMVDFDLNSFDTGGLSESIVELDEFMYIFSLSKEQYAVLGQAAEILKTTSEKELIVALSRYLLKNKGIESNEIEVTTDTTP